MEKPLVVTIEHHSTRAEVLRTLKRRFGDIHAEIAPYVSSVSEEWTDSGLTAEVTALGHSIHSQIDVDDQVVRIEVRLPGLLGIFSGLIETALQRQGPKLLR
jgi:Putative polyhydroxyalkanoic acid system protein (PHA_gran_rgn)